MFCPNCKNTDPQGRYGIGKEMCPKCGYPITPIPTPPNGKIQFGGYDWYVLDKQDGKSLILTEKIIEKRIYHNSEVEITWETCDMRKYLNGAFYNSFSEANRSLIVEVTNQNPDNPWYNTSGGNPTTDKIFLLSIEETIKYFGDSGQLKNRYMYPDCEWCKDEFLPWIDDQYSLNRRAVDHTKTVQDWSLRSPGAQSDSVAFVQGFDGDGYDMGNLVVSGSCGKLEDGHFSFGYPGTGGLTKEHGVRPALWLRT